jgi:phospholipase/carboxylesterase
MNTNQAANVSPNPSPQLSLYHLVQQPGRRSDQPPVLILLHGVRSNEQDLFSLAPYLDPRLLIVSVRAPYTLGRGQYGWYHVTFLPDRIERNAEESLQSRARLAQFIREVPPAYKADPQRVYLMGFSQGAIMSLSLMLTEPGLLAGVVALSGSLPREVLPSAAPPEQLQGFPVMQVHGVYDDVLPIEEGRATRDYLSKLPVRLTYKEYDMAHQVTQESLDDVCAWLTSVVSSHQS